jgi:hypothetical protein
MAKRELTKFLKQLSKEELIKEIEKLYSKVKLVQEYYALELGGDTSSFLNEYKKKMEKQFRPKGNLLNPNMAEVNKIVNQFTKISVHEIDKIDLMLYKVELIKNFMEAWGNEFGGMASSFIRTYDQVVDLIHENDLENHFRQRCEAVEAYGANYLYLNKTL